MGGLVDLQFVGQRWERPTTGSNFVRDTSKKVDLIREHVLMVQSRQASYI